jgi:ABC-2 type transport system permease protein
LPLYIIFSRFLKTSPGIPHTPQYLLLGILLWNYFAEVTSGSVGAIVGRGELLRKINFPKYVIILAGSAAAFINLIFNFIVLGVLMAVGHIGLTWHSVLILPLILELFVFAIALAFILSALYVRYRDVSYIWEVIMQVGFYATPILYALSIIPAVAAKLLILNPMAQIIQDARYALITDKSQTVYQLYDGNYVIWAIPLGITAALLIWSVVYFRRHSRYFAEEV